MRVTDFDFGFFGRGQNGAGAQQQLSGVVMKNLSADGERVSVKTAFEEVAARQGLDLRGYAPTLTRGPSL